MNGIDPGEPQGGGRYEGGAGGHDAALATHDSGGQLSPVDVAVSHPESDGGRSPSDDAASCNGESGECSTSPTDAAADSPSESSVADTGTPPVRRGTPITPGEVDVPALTYDAAPLVVTSAAYGGKGKSLGDPIRIQGCRVRSENDDTPAILISEPGLWVIIDGCTLVGRGPVLISAAGLNYKGKYVDGGWGHLTVLNTRGYGLPPTSAGRGRARFINAGSIKGLRVEHNYLEHLSTIEMPSPEASGEPFLIRYNKAKDMDARTNAFQPIDVGNGGEPGEGHFVSLSAKGKAVPGVEIAWNEIVNFPDESTSGDHVNIYAAQGTKESPIDIHHNFVMGAYPYPSSYMGQGCVGKTSQGGSQWYTGSGMTTDGHGPPISGDSDVTAWVDFHDNRMVNVCNGAINLAAGHDTRAHHNRFVHSGIIPNAGHTPAVGASPGGIFDVWGQGSYFHDNVFDHNEFWWPDANVNIGDPSASVHDNIDLFAQKRVAPTHADELAEYGAYLDAAQAAGIVIGPE